MIEKDISNQDLMRDAKISANIITKIRRGQYMALDKLESICMALGCTLNDILEFIPEEKNNE
ncbi:helix-turn-helix domain-containing protein [Bulleidia extructa]|uniref:helix-turn-helix domain-containing protein n=1 Tax=Bulleidia extructa TaxID=118748 RepID=UPI003BEFFB74